ncbi:MAG: hypothetical protein RBT75_21270 [Anaerolineae bacterium]|jgi:cytochrome c oxidase subunit 4|nr:hypothetical protein [Anaerolineae bacterium]
MGWLNLASLALGLMAWILPIGNLMRQGKPEHKHWMAPSMLSLGACALALCFQIFYTHHLVKIEDWSALMDTSGAVALVSAILLSVTILLNVLTLRVSRDRN